VPAEQAGEENDQLTARELPSLLIGPSQLSGVEEALSTEWLVTNGLGGYASSTILGVNTRKYHGLLVAAIDPPLGRRVLLAKLDEVMVSPSGGRTRLATNDSMSGLDNEGLRSLRSFSLSPFPSFMYDVDGVSLLKTITLAEGENLVLVRYEAVNLRDESVLLEISPLTSYRGIYTVLNSERSPWAYDQQVFDRGFAAHLRDLTLYFAMASDAAEFSRLGGAWVRRLRYRTDEARGDSYLDDCYVPGHFGIHLKAGESRLFHLLASASRSKLDAWKAAENAANPERIWERELGRRRDILRASGELWPEGDWSKWLVLSVDAFIVRGGAACGKSVIAGYHWFGDWGRDTFISLPGLALVTGRFNDAEQILLAYGAHEKDGLIPSFFAEALDMAASYESVDTSLWYVNAVLEYVKYTGNLAFVRKHLWPVLRSIIDHYSAGTQYGIHVDADGLVHHGPRLTWMDAAVNGVPVTPREGKAIEVQALWYNALKTMALLSKALGEDASEYELRAEAAAKSFRATFWNEETGSLFDMVANGSRDSSVRPNQILAVSLDHGMLDSSMAESVVCFVWRKLWATYGLRTLSAEDPKYRGVCRGNQRERDLAYHNGTIWPWLAGPFVKAFLKTKRYEKPWREFAYRSFLQPLLEEQPYQAGLGFISEIFDGDYPHTAGGCIAQAWSTAEPLRAYVEDILYKRPRFEDPSTWTTE